MKSDREKMAEVFSRYEGCDGRGCNKNFKCNLCVADQILEVLKSEGRKCLNCGNYYLCATGRKIGNDNCQSWKAMPEREKQFCSTPTHFRGGSDKGINTCMDCGKEIKWDKPKQKKIEEVNFNLDKLQFCHETAKKLNEVIKYINGGNDE